MRKGIAEDVKDSEKRAARRGPDHGVGWGLSAPQDYGRFRCLVPAAACAQQPIQRGSGPRGCLVGPGGQVSHHREPPRFVAGTSRSGRSPLSGPVPSRRPMHRSRAGGGQAACSTIAPCAPRSAASSSDRTFRLVPGARPAPCSCLAPCTVTRRAAQPAATHRHSMDRDRTRPAWFEEPGGPEQRRVSRRPEVRAPR